MLPIHSPGQFIAGATIATQAVSVAGSAVSGTGQFLNQLASKVSGQSKQDKTAASENPDVGIAPAGLNLSGIKNQFSSIKEETVALRTNVSDRLRQLFRKNGIILKPDINLQVDDLGRVRVQGDHPDKAFIESLLAGDQDLTNDFKKLASFETSLKTAHDALQFQKAYLENPQKAVQDYSSLFDQNREDKVSVRINENIFEVLIK
jgi:hypothetical protein